MRVFNRMRPKQLSKCHQMIGELPESKYSLDDFGFSENAGDHKLSFPRLGWDVDVADFLAGALHDGYCLAEVCSNIHQFHWWSRLNLVGIHGHGNSPLGDNSPGNSETPMVDFPLPGWDSWGYNQLVKSTVFNGCASIAKSSHRLPCEGTEPVIRTPRATPPATQLRFSGV